MKPQDLIKGCWYSGKGNVQQQRKFRMLCIVWAVSLIGISFTLQRGLVSPPLAWVLACVPIVLGGICAIYFWKMLSAGDELYQKIQLHGLAIGFATGIVFGTGYGVLARLGLPSMDLTTLVVLMIVGWMVGQIAAAQKYL